MKPQTEEFLYFLLWTAEFVLRPNIRKVEESFENWAWRRHLGRRLAELHRLKLIESRPMPDTRRIVRLTEAGRVLALGGRDPVAQWKRPWDGQWRLALFDLPAHKRHLRIQLWRALRRQHFGYLQGSVWVSPDSAKALRAILGPAKTDVESLVIVEGRPAAGESDIEIVDGAWDFAAINRHYEHYLRFVAKVPASSLRLPEWARRENALWRAAVDGDPLLPAALHPAGYRGPQAFARRREVFGSLARAISVADQV